MNDKLFLQMMWAKADALATEQKQLQAAKERDRMLRRKSIATVLLSALLGLFLAALGVFALVFGPRTLLLAGGVLLGMLLIVYLDGRIYKQNANDK